VAEALDLPEDAFADEADADVGMSFLGEEVDELLESEEEEEEDDEEEVEEEEEEVEEEDEEEPVNIDDEAAEEELEEEEADAAEGTVAERKERAMRCSRCLRMLGRSLSVNNMIFQSKGAMSTLRRASRFCECHGKKKTRGTVLLTPNFVKSTEQKRSFFWTKTKMQKRKTDPGSNIA